MREELGEKNCGSKTNRKAKNGGAEGGSWCGRESREEVDEELMWAGHVERMDGERLTKRADALRLEATRRGRPKPRWENRGKKDLAGMGGEWIMRASDWEVETVGGDDSEMGLVTKNKGKAKNRRPV